MKTTAAIAREHGQELTIEEIDLDELRPHELRVRIVASGVCHTDAIVRDGVYPTPLPAVLGHEGAGVVEAVGQHVTTAKVGDHVVLAAAYCGHCRQCISGNMVYCENLFAQDFGGRREDGSTAFSSNGEPISSHFFGQSSFAAYANVTETSIVVVDPDLPLETIGPLGCGLQTGAGAVLNELKPKIGSTAAVIGTGAVGFGALMAAAAADCRLVIAIDINDARLELARQMGATHTINSKTSNMLEEIGKISASGVDYIVDTTANPSVLHDAAQALAIRGTLATVGAAAPGTEASFEIGGSLIKGWTFKTIVQGSSIPQEFIPRLIGLWRAGRFPFDRLIRQYPLDQINQAFTDSAEGRVIKPVVVH